MATATRIRSSAKSTPSSNGKIPLELSKVTANIEHVTPSDAEIYLEANTKNYRNVNARTVERYAADMRSGMWRFDGTPICFTEDDVLSDGQHRLRAVVQSGIAQWFLVVRNLPRGSEESPSKDTGKKRCAADHIAYAGHANSNAIAGAIRYLHKMHCRMQKIELSQLSDAMIVALHDKFPTITKFAANNVRVGSYSVNAAFHYLASHENAILADSCMGILAGRTESSTYHPFARLRQMILEGDSSKMQRANISQEAHFDLAMAAWSHVVRGNTTVKVLRTSSKQMSVHIENALREFHL